MTVSVIEITTKENAVADPECARGGGVSQILAEKGVLASLYSKKCMKMRYFHQKGGGVRRVRPMLDPPLPCYTMTVSVIEITTKENDEFLFYNFVSEIDAIADLKQIDGYIFFPHKSGHIWY